MVLSSCRTLNDVFLEFVDFLVHFARNVAHMAAFLRKKIRLVFAVLNLALKPHVFHALAFKPGADLFYDVEIIAGVLFNFVGEHVEIENAVCERVQKVGIVGDYDDTSSLNR